VEATVVEACGGLGAAYGVLTTASQQMKHPQTPRACSRAAIKAGTCLSHQLTHDLTPYVRNGVIGFVVGGLGSLVLVLLALYVRREWAIRRFRKRIPAVISSGPAAPAAVAGADSRRRRSIPERVRHEVWRRDEACCVDCGSRERLEFDHIIPISKGGSNTARNIELRCEICNGRKGARI
jgi:hypothetical protein